MASNFRAPLTLISFFVLLLLSTKFSHAANQSDIDCLKSIKGSLKDWYNQIWLWNFTNGTNSAICQFPGITCSSGMVSKINLAGMGLDGAVPLGVIKCKSLTGLDLSNNHINGHIPKDLANCTSLNLLNLNSNLLNGTIPAEIGNLTELTIFNVSSNFLTGLVPTFRKTIGAESYANNSKLCGGPLPACSPPPPPPRRL